MPLPPPAFTTSHYIPPPSPFFFNDTATTEIYTLSLHDALPILVAARSRLSPDQLRGLVRIPAGARRPGQARGVRGQPGHGRVRRRCGLALGGRRVLADRARRPGAVRLKAGRAQPRHGRLPAERAKRRRASGCPRRLARAKDRSGRPAQDDGPADILAQAVGPRPGARHGLRRTRRPPVTGPSGSRTAGQTGSPTSGWTGSGPRRAGPVRREREPTLHGRTAWRWHPARVRGRIGRAPHRRATRGTRRRRPRFEPGAPIAGRVAAADRSGEAR